MQVIQVIQVALTSLTVCTTSTSVEFRSTLKFFGKEKKEQGCLIAGSVENRSTSTQPTVAVIISLPLELMLSASASGGFDLSFYAVEGSSDCCFPFIIFSHYCQWLCYCWLSPLCLQGLVRMMKA